MTLENREGDRQPVAGAGRAVLPETRRGLSVLQRRGENGGGGTGRMGGAGGRGAPTKRHRRVGWTLSLLRCGSSSLVDEVSWAGGIRKGLSRTLGSDQGSSPPPHLLVLQESCAGLLRSSSGHGVGPQLSFYQDQGPRYTPPDPCDPCVPSSHVLVYRWGKVYNDLKGHTAFCLT